MSAGTVSSCLVSLGFSLKVALTPAASVSCPLSKISEKVGWADSCLALVPISKTICTVGET